MSPADSLFPDRTRTDLSVDAARNSADLNRDAPTGILTGPDRALDAKFEEIFGAEGRDVRAAVSERVAAEGQAVYDLFSANPESFGMVVGDRTKADVLGRTLEAFDYSKEFQLAEREGREPNVQGFLRVRGQQPETASTDEGATGRTPLPAGSLERGDDIDPGPSALDNGEGPDHLPPDVSAAVAEIRGALSGQFVGPDDLRDAEQALFALQGDGPSRAIKALDQSDLVRWADNLNDSGPVTNVFGGYEASERTAFYTRLGERVDGAGLSEFGRAVAEVSPSYSSELNEGQRFAAAVSSVATPYVRAEMADNLMLHVQEDPEVAVMVAETIGSLSDTPDTVSTLLTDTSVEDLHVLIRASVLLDRNGPAPAQRLLGAIAQTQDADLKSRAFVAASVVRQQAANVIEGALGGESEESLQSHGIVSVQAGMLSSMSILLESQTNDIVQSLKDEHDPNGRALTDYAGAMIDSGNVDGLTQDIARLKRGDIHLNDPEAEQIATAELVAGESRETASVGTEDEIVRFRSQSVNQYEEPVYANAERLGHFVGTVAAALTNRADFQNERPEELGTLLGMLNGNVGTVTQQVAQPFADRRVAELKAIKDDIELAAFPRGADNHRYTGKAGINPYTTAFNEIYDRNVKSK